VIVVKKKIIVASPGSLLAFCTA